MDTNKDAQKNKDFQFQTKNTLFGQIWHKKLLI